MVSRIRMVEYDCVVCGKRPDIKPAYTYSLYCADHQPDWYQPSKIGRRVDDPSPSQSKQHG